ncbi:MAG: hypothetical protein P8Z42_13600 [Anaerolineales bacterium]
MSTASSALQFKQARKLLQRLVEPQAIDLQSWGLRWRHAQRWLVERLSKYIGPM